MDEDRARRISAPGRRRGFTRRRALGGLLGLGLAACAPVRPSVVEPPTRPSPAGAGPQPSATATAPAPRPASGSGDARPTPLVASLVTVSPKPGALLPPLKVALLWWSDATAPVELPVAAAVDRQQHLYVLAAGQGRLQVFDRVGQALRAWGNPGADAGQFRFRRPDRCADDNLSNCIPDVGGGVAVDDQGRVYVADYGNSRVQVFDDQGRVLAAWGREGSAPGEFLLPSGIAVDGQGRVYVSDSENHRIQVFDRQGRFQTSWGRLGSAPGAFLRPGGLALDAAGQLHVADLWNDRLHVLDRRGQVAREWPVPVEGLMGSRAYPRASGVAVDRQGRVFIGGAGSQVQVFNHQGQALTGWQRFWGSVSGSQNPVGLAVDDADDLYVADLGQTRVAKLRLLAPTTR